MKTAIILLLLLALSFTVQSIRAADSTYQLEGGGSVAVDPDTKRATVTRDGVSTPLHDGTHQTQDGTTLIIRRGVTVIPNEPPPPPREPEELAAEHWEGAPIVGYSPCERLVRTVCGKQDQCADIEGCALARQLLDMETQERNSSENRNRMSFTSGQCVEMTPDTGLFPACGK